MVYLRTLPLYRLELFLNSLMSVWQNNWLINYIPSVTRTSLDSLDPNRLTAVTLNTNWPFQPSLLLSTVFVAFPKIPLKDVHAVAPLLLN